SAVITSNAHSCHCDSFVVGWRDQAIGSNAIDIGRCCCIDVIERELYGAATGRGETGSAVVVCEGFQVGCDRENWKSAIVSGYAHARNLYGIANSQAGRNLINANDG